MAILESLQPNTFMGTLSSYGKRGRFKIPVRTLIDKKRYRIRAKGTPLNEHGAILGVAIDERRRDTG